VIFMGTLSLVDPVAYPSLQERKGKSQIIVITS